MEVVWEFRSTNGILRKRSAKACDACKRRKKKCSHTRWLGTSPTPRVSSPSPPNYSPRSSNDQQSFDQPDPAVALHGGTQPGPMSGSARYVSPLNPDPSHTSNILGKERLVSHQRDAQRRAVTVSSEQTESHELEVPVKVGDYHAESLLTELVSESPEDRGSRPATMHGNNLACDSESSVTQLVGRRNTFSPCCTETIQRHARRWTYDLEVESKAWIAEDYHENPKWHNQSCDGNGESCDDGRQALTLPRDTQDALVTAYISNLDALLPIVDGSQVLRDYATGTASPYLINAICLSACKMKQAAPNLRLSESSPTLSPRKFAKAIYRDLEVAIGLDLEPNRVTKIQILALMWLHHDDNRGVQKSSAYLCQAIHDALVLGLHFENPGRSHRMMCKYLFWTLRAFDRQNACLQGVPLVIADRDVDISRPVLQANGRAQAAVISSRLGDLMDDVMRIYRPFLQRKGQTVLDDFPTFAEVADGTDLGLLQESQKDYLEIWYHVLAMLSCRSSTPGTEPYERRFRGAQRVRELTCNGRHVYLPPLPMIHYAVSLSLTVAWRALKDCPKASEKLTSNITSILSTLHELAQWSPMAAEMSRLGQKFMSLFRSPPSTTIAVDGSHAATRTTPITSAATHDHEHRPAIANSNQSPSALGYNDPIIGTVPSASNLASDLITYWEDPPIVGPRFSDESSSETTYLPPEETHQTPTAAPFPHSSDHNVTSAFADGEIYNASSLGFGANIDDFQALMNSAIFAEDSDMSMFLGNSGF